MDNPIFLYTSAFAGFLAIAAVVYVYIKSSEIGKPGFGLLIAGVILIGLPVWHTVKFDQDDKGVHIQLETVNKKLDALNTQLGEAQKTYAQTNNNLKGIAANVEKVRAIGTLNFASRIAAASPDQNSAFTAKFKPLWDANGKLDPKAAEAIAKDPQVQIWMDNADLFSGKVGEKLPNKSLDWNPNGTMEWKQ